MNDWRANGGYNSRRKYQTKRWKRNIKLEKKGTKEKTKRKSIKSGAVLMELQNYSITFSVLTDSSLASGLLSIIVVLNVCVCVTFFGSSAFQLFFLYSFPSFTSFLVGFAFFLPFCAHHFIFIHLHPTCCVPSSALFDLIRRAFRMTFYTSTSRLCYNYK